MKIIKRIIIIVLILPLFILTSCGKKAPVGPSRTPITPTSDLVFCANAMYDSIDEIPTFIISYSCYEEEFEENINLKIRFGQACYILSEDGHSSTDIYDEELIDTKNNYYILCLVDKENNKKDLFIQLKNCLSGNSKKIIFWEIYNKYIFYYWYRNNDNISIPKDYFTESEGEIYLSVFEKNKSTFEEKSLVTVTIKYINNEGKIKLIAPEKSFSGKGIDEGKTDEEIFKNI